MNDDDGVALMSIAHPRPRWWARPFWWLRSLRGIRASSIETVEINIDRKH